MTYYEAARQVLSSSQQSLTTRQITADALRRELITPQGRTPEATMSAALYRQLGKDPQLIKIDTPGARRAARGTVRWALAN